MPGDMLHHDQYPQNTNKKAVLFFEMIEKYINRRNVYNK